MVGQWQFRITIRSDAFDETTVAVPVSVHQCPESARYEIG